MNGTELMAACRLGLGWVQLSCFSHVSVQLNMETTLLTLAGERSGKSDLNNCCPIKAGQTAASVQTNSNFNARVSRDHRLWLESIDRHNFCQNELLYNGIRLFSL